MCVCLCVHVHVCVHVCQCVCLSVCHPAFDTPTGLPYGTINLLYGVPPGEVPITCTACCASFIVEFGTLSRLTGTSVGGGAVATVGGAVATAGGLWWQMC